MSDIITVALISSAASIVIIVIRELLVRAAKGVSIFSDQERKYIDERINHKINNAMTAVELNFSKKKWIARDDEED